MTNPHRSSSPSCSLGCPLCRIKPAAPSRGSTQTGGESTLAWRMLQGFSMSVESNGVAERMNRTLFDITRSLIINCAIPTPFWGEAIHTACQIHNRLSSRLTNNISHHQLWFGNAPTFKAFHRFGCIAYARALAIPKGAKVDPHGIRCCFLGYVNISQGIPALGPPTWTPDTIQRCQIYRGTIPNARRLFYSYDDLEYALNLAKASVDKKLDFIQNQVVPQPTKLT
jgi:hypothetical protein